MSGDKSITSFFLAIHMGHKALDMGEGENLGLRTQRNVLSI